MFDSCVQPAIANLTKRYGTWEIKWGDINRYQRPKDGVTFDDSKPSFPVGLASSTFGQLPSFQSKAMNTKNLYGYSGNSFIDRIQRQPFGVGDGLLVLFKFLLQRAGNFGAHVLV